jgi:hypothetical protein
MTRFGDFLRRIGKKPHTERAEYPIHTAKINKQRVEQIPSLDSSSDIASIRAAGMQRSNQGTYITTHGPARHGEFSRRHSFDSSIVSDSSKTAVEKNAVPVNNTSVWKGAANGRQYDKREELSPEDEDMWAKMAM